MPKVIDNVHIYPSTFTHESRILKETQTLLDHDVVQNILIIARGDGQLQKEETIDNHREVHRVTLKLDALPKNIATKLLKYGEFVWRTYRLASQHPLKFINAHNLAVLPACVLIKWKTKATLIYDTHELETERNGIGGIVQRLMKCTERLCMRWVDQTIVVSPHIKQWYKEAYPHVPVHLVRNIPRKKDIPQTQSTILKDNLAIPQEDLLFVYQGSLEAGRGIDILLNAWKTVGKTKHLVFLGYGSLEDTIKAVAADHEHIHFHPAVSPNEVQAYTASADVGIALIENSSLSYYYCLPNKLFEYILNGVPALVSDFPDMGSIIDTYNCGWKTTKETIAKDVQALSLDAIKEKTNGTSAAKKQLSWEQEEPALLACYQSHEKAV